MRENFAPKPDGKNFRLDEVLDNSRVGEVQRFNGMSNGKRWVSAGLDGRCCLGRRFRVGSFLFSVPCPISLRARVYSLFIAHYLPLPQYNVDRVPAPPIIPLLRF